MASSSKGKRSKVNGDSWGEQSTDGQAPVVFGAEQALGGKGAAIEATKFTSDSSRLCGRP
jgi:hypothetical protein